MANILKQSIGKDLGMHRDVQINVRLTAPEKRKFEKLAEKRHTDISELVRQLLHREADLIAEKA
jgi:hypothetical protein